MIAGRILMLIVAVAFVYILFARVGPVTGPAPGLARPAGTAAAARAPDEYRAAMDKAQAVARQMQAQRAEADAP